MTVEIRPVDRDDAVDYLRVLPFANGLPSWEPAPAAWWAGEGPWPPAGRPASAEQLEQWADDLVAQGVRTQAAYVDGRIVGGSALLSLELTVPGPVRLPFAGVTSTGVVATHRRRGLLRALMAAMFDDARAHGEAIVGLSASEGTIYGRFGFSPATTRTRWELGRADAALRHEAADLADVGALELVDAAVARAAWPRLHEVARRRRVGEVSPQPDQWAGLDDAPDGLNGPSRFVVHRDERGEIDGVARYRLPWSSDPAAVGTLAADGFEATTPAAYAALWRLLADFDLTRRVVAAPRPLDEPLRWMLRNPRALRVTRHTDNLWLRLLDVPAALSARRYAVAGRLTVAVTADPTCPDNVGRWALDAGPDGAECRRADAATADVSLDVAALASVYLGGVSPGTLVAAGRMQEHRPGAAAVMARLFAADPAPFNAIGF